MMKKSGSKFMVLAVSGAILATCIADVEMNNMKAEAAENNNIYEEVADEYCVCPELIESITYVEGVHDTATKDDINDICKAIVSYNDPDEDEECDIYDALVDYSGSEEFATEVLDMSYNLERKNGK